MAMTMHVDIVSAEQQIYSGRTEMLCAPLAAGEAGIMPGHTPLIGKLLPGEVTIRKDGEEQSFYVSGGLLEVQPHTVTVLADTAVRANDIDEAAAIQAKEAAERTLKDQQADLSMAKALAELSQAAAQLRAINNFKKRGK